jgi:hypothetical protein
MLVSAWEALISERKVLVVSTNTAIIPYCCEFLHRLVLPLIIVFIAPILPKESLTAIEAPFPCLVRVTYLNSQTDSVLVQAFLEAGFEITLTLLAPFLRTE